MLGRTWLTNVYCRVCICIRWNVEAFKFDLKIEQVDLVSERWFGIFQNAWFLIFCTLLWRVIEMSCVHVIHTTKLVEEIESYLYVCHICYLNWNNIRWKKIWL